MNKRVGDSVTLYGKRNKSLNGKVAKIKSIHIRSDGKAIVTVHKIDGLHPLSSKEYFSDQVK